MRIAGGLRGLRVLDYGCGDGTFLGLLIASENRPKIAVGAEFFERMVTSNRERFHDVEGLEFINQQELESAKAVQPFDAIVCMEVLEHTLDRIHYLDLFHRLLRPGGKLIISVPVETGFPLLVKTMVRKIAGWRGIGDYPGIEPYTVSEFLKSLFAGTSQHIERPSNSFAMGDGTLFTSHSHKGFNWAVVRREISERFILDRVSASPLAFLPPQLGSQVWFEAHRA